MIRRFLIDATGNCFHAVILRTHPYWSDAFEQDVRASIRIRPAK